MTTKVPNSLTEQPPTLVAAVASTSGTTVDFASIPSWVNKITISLNGVSTNAASSFIVQLGTAAGFEATSYVSAYAVITSAAAAAFATGTTGFVIVATSLAADTVTGTVVLTRLSGNTWMQSAIMYRSSAGTSTIGYSTGSKTLADVLTQLRVGTIAGDTLDAGSVSILYE